MYNLNYRILTPVVILLLYVSAAFSMDEGLNAIALYFLLPLALSFTFLQKFRLKVNSSLNILIFLYIWILLVTPFSTDLSLSTMQLKQIFGCMIMCYIFAIQSQNEKMMPWLYMVYIVMYAVNIDYLVNNVIGTIDVGDERMDDERMNANALAYLTFYVTFVVFLFGEIIQCQWLRRMFRMAFFLTIPLFLWVAYVTASRQVIMLQAPLVAVLLFMRYWQFGNGLSKIWIVLLILGLFSVLYKTITQVFENSLLMERYDEISDDTRLTLVKETVDIGLHNPIVGVGPGCVRLYTSERAFAHNSYLELFAGTGIVGLLIYVILLWRYMALQIRRYRLSNDRLYLYFLVFGVFFTIDQIFYVFYYSLYLISFFILVASHSEIYFNNRVNTRYLTRT